MLPAAPHRRLAKKAGTEKEGRQRSFECEQRGNRFSGVGRKRERCFGVTLQLLALPKSRAGKKLQMR